MSFIGTFKEKLPKWRISIFMNSKNRLNGKNIDGILKLSK